MKSKIYPFLFSLLIASIFSCQNDNSDSGSHDSNEPNYSEENVEEQPLTEEELKEQLLETECSERAKYIDGTLKYEPIYKNLLSMKVTGLKLTLNLTNSATLATFKDIDVRVTFTSKTGAIILEEMVTIYEFISPNNSIVDKKEINCSNQEYTDISDVTWTVVDASCD